MQPGDIGLYAGGAYSWSHRVPAGIKGGGVGFGFDRFELGTSYFALPEGGWGSSSARGVLSASARVVLQRHPEAPFTLAANVVHQRIAYDVPTRTRAERTTVSNTYGLTFAFPIDAGGGGTLVPQVTPYAMRIRYPWDITSTELGVAATLGIRQALPGAFALVVEPSLGYAMESGTTFGLSLGLLLAGGGRQR